MKEIIPPSQCRHGHDLTNPENVTIDAARWRCLVCMREDTRIRRRNQSANLRHVTCKACGKAKWPDRRTMCLKCAHEAARRLAPVEVVLSEAVAAECLMPWERPKRSVEPATPLEPRSAPDVTPRQARPDD